MYGSSGVYVLSNLLLLVLIHGFNDAIGLTMIYLDKEFFIPEWVRQLL